MKPKRNDKSCRLIIDYITFVLCNGNSYDARKIIQYLHCLHNGIKVGHWIINYEEVSELMIPTTDGGEIEVTSISNCVAYKEYEKLKYILEAVVGSNNLGYEYYNDDIGEYDCQEDEKWKAILLHDYNKQGLFKNNNIISFRNNDNINVNVNNLSQIEYITNYHIPISHDREENYLTPIYRVNDNNLEEYNKVFENDDGKNAFLYYMKNIEKYEPPLIFQKTPIFFPIGYYMSDSHKITYLGKDNGNITPIKLESFLHELSRMGKGKKITTFVDASEKSQKIASIINKNYDIVGI